eukprot:GDKK01072749.1.p1 GENE.GDKK01072749.1~~GDKK01072749.1.p1  ORF type:complete len:628 (+),score=133.86 GDKK01072749.1:95-1978(+)
MDAVDAIYATDDDIRDLAWRGASRCDHLSVFSHDNPIFSTDSNFKQSFAHEDVRKNGYSSSSCKLVKNITTSTAPPRKSTIFASTASSRARTSSNGPVSRDSMTNQNQNQNVTRQKSGGTRLTPVGTSTLLDNAPHRQSMGLALSSLANSTQCKSARKPSAGDSIVSQISVSPTRSSSLSRQKPQLSAAVPSRSHLNASPLCDSSPRAQVRKISINSSTTSSATGTPGTRLQQVSGGIRSGNGILTANLSNASKLNQSQVSNTSSRSEGRFSKIQVSSLAHSILNGSSASAVSNSAASSGRHNPARPSSVLRRPPSAPSASLNNTSTTDNNSLKRLSPRYTAPTANTNSKKDQRVSPHKTPRPPTPQADIPLASPKGSLMSSPVFSAISPRKPLGKSNIQTARTSSASRDRSLPPAPTSIARSNTDKTLNFNPSSRNSSSSNTISASKTSLRAPPNSKPSPTRAAGAIITSALAARPSRMSTGALHSNSSSKTTKTNESADHHPTASKQSSSSTQLSNKNTAAPPSRASRLASIGPNGSTGTVRRAVSTNCAFTSQLNNNNNNNLKIQITPILECICNTVLCLLILSTLLLNNHNNNKLNNKLTPITLTSQRQIPIRTPRTLLPTLS